ncbi:Uncharacterized protein HDE_05382 [Halotydeus destructor]|nr:Uncharacterized protein HDE_05382 [Halotydeus destructor]
MSSAVWVIISIPTPEREKQLRTDGRSDDDRIDDSSVSRYATKLVANVFHSEVSGKKSPDNPKDSSAFRKGASFIPLKKILEDAFDELQVVDVVWYLTKNGKGYQIYFPVDLESSDAIIDYFVTKGIGVQRETFIGMIPFALFYREEDAPEVFDEPSSPKSEDANKLFSFKSMQDKFLKSVTARLTVAQVVESVRSGAELTFDFLLYIILAAWIAAMGLLDNSVVNVVASMLVSPLMGPVMAMTFGTIIRNKELRDMGIRNAVIGFGICIVFGYFFGLLCLNFTQDWNPNSMWPTPEMQARGQLRVLWIGTLVALPSGAAVALSLLSGNQSSLVGVAISASLLPPCVNCGLLWAFATLKALKSFGEDAVTVEFTDSGWRDIKPSVMPPDGYNVQYNDNMAVECLFLGIVSLGLVTVNVICIFVMAFTLLKIKEVAPMSSMSSATSRFWKEDVKIAREHPESTSNLNTMGEDFLKEWAQMMGIDERQFLSDTPQARAARVQTLRDMLKDVESDDVFRQIARSTQAPRASLHPDLVAYDYEGNPLAGSSRRDSLFHSEAMRRASRIHQARRTSAFFPNVLQPGNLYPADNERRRSSALLKKNLLTTDHLPMSMWPNARPRSSLEARFQVTPVPFEYGVRGRASLNLPQATRRSTSRLASTEESQSNL